MLSTIIFSKNRPLQLDLCLKSVEENWIGGDVFVLYDCDNEYIKAYDTCSNEHNKVKFFRQNSFSKTLSTCLKLCNDNYIAFLTDDNIVYKKCYTDKKMLGEIFAQQEVGCLSLRLGVNITERDGRKVAMPTFTRLGHHLLWNRMSYLAQSYWNYPLSVDGHVFRTQFIRWIWDCHLQYENISGPNRLESLMQRFFFEIGPFKVCENYSKVVNSPNNRVQNDIPNWYGDHYHYEPQDLLKKYLDGHRINLQSLEFDVKCPHQEIELL